jgi:succinoglycan biosynthesis protein ExoA
VADAPTASVIVPCLNEEAHIGKLITAVARQSVPPADIVIIDGGSTDATLDAIRGAALDVAPLCVRTIVAPDDWLPAVVNRGVREAQGRVLIRLDGHAAPSPDYISRALAQLADPGVGVVGGVWRIVPGAPTPIAAAIARAVAHPLGAGDAAYRLRDGGPVMNVDTVPFGCFTRETWRRVGGLNETLLGNEDYEFNYRVRKAGLLVRLDPTMQSTYVARARLGALALQYFRYGWCKMQMLRQHPGALRWRQAVPVAFVGTTAILALLAPFFRPAAWLAVAELASYLGVVVLTTVSICAREGGWRRAWGLIAAFVTIHVCWGTGALVYLCTRGHWPDRRFLFGIRAPA